MEYRVNTAVIGGGPAGMICAIQLQKQGIENLVIEKATFPREKTCAGLVTSKTYQLLAQVLDGEPDFESVFCNTSQTILLSNNNQTLARATVSIPFRLVKRAKFDAFLATCYQKNGGNLLQNTTCRSVDAAGRRLELSNGDAVVFQNLVVADGARSETRKLLGYRPPELGFCVETHLPRAAWMDETVQVDFGVIPKGYAWVFPSGQECCIGLGGVYQKGTDYRALLHQFLGTLGIKAQDVAVKGAFLPYGKPVRQNKAGGHVLLVGDAAGYADPISGEGLYFAAASGMAAAEAIAGQPECPRPVYLRKMKAGDKIIRQGSRFQKFFFKPYAQRMFQKAIKGRSAFLAFCTDRQISEYAYSYSRTKLFKLCRDYKKGKKGQ